MVLMCRTNNPKRLLGSETKGFTTEEEEKQEPVGYALRENPSDVFIRFINQYPNSRIAEEYEKYKKDFPLTAGGFAHALYDGEIDTAIYLADEDNRKKMCYLLFPEVKDRLITLDWDKKVLRTHRK